MSQGLKQIIEFVYIMDSVDPDGPTVHQEVRVKMSQEPAAP
jgi:hypothetical protein